MPQAFVLRLALTPADVGARVVVRRALPEGGFGDLLGELVSWADGVLTVRTGEDRVVGVAQSTVVAGKRVPAPPVRGEQVRALERAGLSHWPALETEQLGGWLLQAADGFTGRANSVLALDGPGVPVGEALERVCAWYAQRSLPARFRLPLPLMRDLDATLERDGWVGYNPTLVLATTTRQVVGRVAGPGRDLPPVRLAGEPTDEWLAAYHYRGEQLPPVARRVLAGASAQRFATVRDGGAVLAIGRVAAGGGWAGITSMEVAPPARRRGLGGRVLAALCAWAQQAGAERVYLQVAEENAPARVLYARWGFTGHHRYVYRSAP